MLGTKFLQKERTQLLTSDVAVVVYLASKASTSTDFWANDGRFLLDSSAFFKSNLNKIQERHFKNPI